MLRFRFVACLHFSTLVCVVRMTCIVDCCHSGTIFDLPFVYVDDGKQTKMEAATEDRFRFPHLQVVQKLKRQRMFEEYAGFMLVATIALLIPYLYFPSRA